MLSRRIGRIAPSLTLAISAKADAMKSSGKDVVSFGAGEPDFRSPEVACEAAIRAIREGKTRYTAVDGIPELKDAIRKRFLRDHGLEYNPAQIAATVGAKQAIFNLLLAALDPGDEVLVPAPYWVSYPDMVRLADGEPKIVPTTAADGYRLRADALERALTPRSKILILNSPCNPTGAALTRDDLAAIGEVALRHNLWIISDEIYEKLVFDGFRQVSIASIDRALYDRTVIVNGVSKTYAMTGWRIGYVAGPEAWVRAAVKLQSQSTSNPTSVAQYAAAAALALDDAEVDGMRQEFQRRRDRIVSLLNAIAGVRCPTPQGAFYVLPDVSRAISGKYADSGTFASELLDKALVAVVPGEGFGAPGCIRLSYACSMGDIERGVGRIAEFLGTP